MTLKLKAANIRQLSWLLAAGWTLILLASFVTGKRQQSEIAIQVATAQGNAHYEQDLTTRAWAAGHGGIYVPVTERTQPNPYLSHLQFRDLESPSGQKLTLMNPAYMTRQLNEDLAELKGTRSKITSLNCLRPENAPDAWERRALLQLDQGKAEVCEVVTGERGEYLRLMRPLFVLESCLKCHGTQGYEVGDLRGGIGVTVPLEMLKSVSRKTIIRQQWIHLGLWALGLVGILASGQLLIRGLHEQEQMSDRVQLALKATDAIIENVPFGIAIVGRDKIVRRVNRTAMGILGRDENEIVGRICHENFCPALEGKCPVLDEGQELDNSAREVIGPGGRKVPILKTVIPFNFQGEDVLLEAFIDTTEQTMKNQELLDTVEELQRFNSLAVGRELRMGELKEEVNVLLEELERSPRYEFQKSSVKGGGS